MSPTHTEESTARRKHRNLERARRVKAQRTKQRRRARERAAQQFARWSVREAALWRDYLLSENPADRHKWLAHLRAMP